MVRDAYNGSPIASSSPKQAIPKTRSLSKVSPLQAQLPPQLGGHNRRSQNQSQQPKQSNAEIELETMETLEDTRTSAQFILKSLMIAFEMKMKQAAALLQDNQKYLFHMCVKGMKGNNFTRVKQWYQLVLPYANHLVHLINEELSNQAIIKPSRLPNSKGGQASRNLFRTLNILKGGFYSQDEEVARCCISLFQAMVTETNKIGGDIVGQNWDWFVTSTAIKKTKP